MAEVKQFKNEVRDALIGMGSDGSEADMLTDDAAAVQMEKGISADDVAWMLWN